MNTTKNVVETPAQTPVLQQLPRKRFVRSLEYELIAGLARKQYVREGVIRFEDLLSIPLADRIPGLANNYGLHRTHRLVKLMLQEFCYSIPLPRFAKLTETKIAACACDLILAAYEDQLSLEDLVVFFEKAKEGEWGKFKGMVTHLGIMQKLEQFRDARSETYHRLKEAQEAAFKQTDNLPRIGEVRSIGEILSGGDVINMNRRMSG